MTEDWADAARSGDAEPLADQLSAGANVDALDRHGQTALMLAAPRGHLEAVRLLIRAGADLDRTGKYRLTATMLAAVNHQEAVARELAAAGANLHFLGSGAPGFAGKSAAQLATDAGLESLARDLTPTGEGAEP
jgi:ankyrin repeat protein